MFLTKVRVTYNGLDVWLIPFTIHWITQTVNQEWELFKNENASIGTYPIPVVGVLSPKFLLVENYLGSECRKRQWLLERHDSTSELSYGICYQEDFRNQIWIWIYNNTGYILQHFTYLSWPAVSQISNLTAVSSMHTVCVRKAAPIVLSWNSWNWPLTKRNTNDDLPTADSPNSTNLNWHILPCADPFGRWAVALRWFDAILVLCNCYFAVALSVLRLEYSFVFNRRQYKHTDVNPRE